MGRVGEVNCRLLIVADIEGSSGCLSREGSALKTDAWALACRELSRDVDAVVRALFDAGADRILVKDFHRSGYNLLRECIDPRAELLLGYRKGSVPGMGTMRGLDAALFIGMHAASGTEGFLAHTMTSRIARLEVDGRPVTELELFASALAAEGIRPLFFSGCPVACAQAETALPGIRTWPIEKAEPRGDFSPQAWRRGLAEAAVKALSAPPLTWRAPGDPFRAVAWMRDGEKEAARLAKRWKLPHSGDRILIDAPSMAGLYAALIDICYLTPLVKLCIGPALFFFNLHGRTALSWARRRLSRATA
jgi:D-amino peptidase